MKRRVYIATGLAHAARAQLVRDALIGAGWDISYDWTTHGRVSGDARMRQVAIDEINGVTTAHAVVAILPGYRGTHVEIGAAIAAGVPVFLFEPNGVPADGPWTSGTTSFYHHPYVRRFSWRDDADLAARVCEVLDSAEIMFRSGVHWRAWLPTSTPVGDALYVIEVDEQHRSGRGRFERPGRQGYTNDLRQAGVWLANEIGAVKSSETRIPVPLAAVCGELDKHAGAEDLALLRSVMEAIRRAGAAGLGPRVPSSAPDAITFKATTGPVDEARELARLIRGEPVADDDGGTLPPRDAVDPLSGMPRFRCRLTGRIEVDGEQPGGVIAQFLILGSWHEVELPAERFDGEPCESMDDLERMVLRDLEEVDGVRPEGVVHLRPLVTRPTTAGGTA